VVAPAPAPGHNDTDRAVVMTVVTSPSTAPDLTTASSSAAKAHAAMVPTAYSAVDMPDSLPRRSSCAAVARVMVLFLMVPLLGWVRPRVGRTCGWWRTPVRLPGQVPGQGQHDGHDGDEDEGRQVGQPEGDDEADTEPGGADLHVGRRLPAQVPGGVDQG